MARMRAIDARQTARGQEGAQSHGCQIPATVRGSPFRSMVSAGRGGQVARCSREATVNGRDRPAGVFHRKVAEGIEPCHEHVVDRGPCPAPLAAGLHTRALPSMDWLVCVSLGACLEVQEERLEPESEAATTRTNQRDRPPPSPPTSSRPAGQAGPPGEDRPAPPHPAPPALAPSTTPRAA